MRNARIIIGVLLWAVATLVLWQWVQRWEQGRIVRQVAPQLWQFASGKRHSIVLDGEERLAVSVGDPIFIIDGQQSRQVGEITVVRQASGQVQATALFYSAAPAIVEGTEVHYHEVPDSMEWVLETMLPPAKRAEVAAEIQAAVTEHHQEIFKALQPVVTASLREALLVVEEELPGAIQRHRPELEALGAKYQRDIIERDIVPLVRAEIWPIVSRRAEPTAERLGQDIWQRASLWRFGWRLAYDRLPLTDRDLVRGEWSRFVEQEALPALEGYTDEFISLQQAILVDVARNARVRKVLRDSMAQMLDDPQLQAVATDILRELLVDSPRLREVFHRHWTSPEARQALQIAVARLEPTAERIGQLLLGSPEQGITPEFARVLRNRILNKDRRWLVLHQPSLPHRLPTASVIPLRRAPAGSSINPFVSGP